MTIGLLYLVWHPFITVSITSKPKPSWILSQVSQKSVSVLYMSAVEASGRSTQSMKFSPQIFSRQHWIMFCRCRVKSTMLERFSWPVHSQERDVIAYTSEDKSSSRWATLVASSADEPHCAYVLSFSFSVISINIRSSQQRWSWYAFVRRLNAKKK